MMAGARPPALTDLTLQSGREDLSASDLDDQYGTYTFTAPAVGAAVLLPLGENDTLIADSVDIPDEVVDTDFSVDYATGLVTNLTLTPGGSYTASYFYEEGSSSGAVATYAEPVMVGGDETDLPMAEGGPMILTDEGDAIMVLVEI